MCEMDFVVAGMKFKFPRWTVISAPKGLADYLIRYSLTRESMVYSSSLHGVSMYVSIDPSSGEHGGWGTVGTWKERENIRTVARKRA